MLIVSRVQLHNFAAKLPSKAACFRLSLVSGKRSMSTGNATYSLVITPSELASLPRSSTKPIDVTWFMPNVPRDPYREFLAKRIPGSRRLDLDEVASEHELGLKHMMPSSEVFAEACESIGIEPSSHVVFYDSIGVFSSPRALFMFKAFGHKKASILNGGLPGWVHEGHPTESGELPSAKRASYPKPTLDSKFIRGKTDLKCLEFYSLNHADYADIVKNAQTASNNAEIVLDARSRGRFTGVDPEPRPSLSSGHIPNSRSLPFTELLESRTAGPDSSYTVLRPATETKAIFEEVLGNDGLGPQSNIINSCGSGMTAGVLWLALQELGVNSAIYDE
ncbi:hypothetical protein FRC03_007864, partial [Tulasnella sp. 419]